MSKFREKITLKQRNRFNHIVFIFSHYNFIKIRLRLILSLIIISITQTTNAQDLRFTQFHASDTWINPAFSGIKGQPRLEINVRDQWPAIPQTYVSYRAAFDTYASALNSGLGLFLVKDDEGQGVIQTFSMGGQYNYQIQLSDALALNVGLQATYEQHSIQWDQLQFYDQINPIYGFTDASGNPNLSTQSPPTNQEMHYMDFAAGTLLYSNKWYAGFSIAHLTQPNQSFYSETASNLPMAVTIQTGLQISKDYKIDPFIYNPIAIFTRQQNFTQIMAGSYIKKGNIIAGAFAKYNLDQVSDVSALLGLKKGWMTFAYSYDIPLGYLQGESGGAHEVSIVVLFEESSTKSKTKRQKHALDCPSVL